MVVTQRVWIMSVSHLRSVGPEDPDRGDNSWPVDSGQWKVHQTPEVCVAHCLEEASLLWRVFRRLPTGNWDLDGLL